MTKFSVTGYDPACETLAAEMQATLKEIIALWPRATDMRALASEALEKVTMPNHTKIRNLRKRELDYSLAELVTEYHKYLSMADIVDSLQLALNAAEESGEK